MASSSPETNTKTTKPRNPLAEIQRYRPTPNTNTTALITETKVDNNSALNLKQDSELSSAYSNPIDVKGNVTGLGNQQTKTKGQETSSHNIKRTKIEFAENLQGQSKNEQSTSKNGIMPTGILSKSITDRNLLRRTPESEKSIHGYLHGSREVIVNQTHIFIRQCRPLKKFLNDDNTVPAVAQFELMDLYGNRLFFAKQVKGDGSQLYFGGTLDVVIYILELEGRQLLKIEGCRGKGGLGEHYLIYIQETMVGEIVQSNTCRCNRKQFLFINEDDLGFGFLEKKKKGYTGRRQGGFFCRLLNLKQIIRRIFSICSNSDDNEGQKPKSIVCYINSPDGCVVLARRGIMTMKYSRRRSSLTTPIAPLELSMPNRSEESKDIGDVNNKLDCIGINFTCDCNVNEREILIASLFLL